MKSCCALSANWTKVRDDALGESNIDGNLHIKLQKLRTHALIPKSIAIRSFVYHLTTGLPREIKDAWTSLL